MALEAAKERAARVEPAPTIDAGLRYKPTLERASNTPEGWIADMEQAHDGEWIHIGTVRELMK